MVATDIAAAVRYSNTLNKTVYVCPTMVDYTSPSRAELNAGTRIDRVIPKDGIAGFAGSESTITADDLKTGVMIPVHDGEDWSQGSTINAHLSKSGTDIRSVLTKGTSLYIVIFDSTDTAALKMDVFPVFVGSAQKSRSGLAMVTIGCTFTGVPAVDVTVPA